MREIEKERLDQRPLHYRKADRRLARVRARVELYRSTLSLSYSSRGGTSGAETKKREGGRKLFGRQGQGFLVRGGNGLWCQNGRIFCPVKLLKGIFLYIGF